MFGLLANLFHNPIKAIPLLALLLAGLSAQAQVGTAVRELPYDFHPGDLVEVRIQVTPPPGTTNWSVREFYPDRWEFISSTNASFTNEFTGELFFGPFTDATPRTLSYEILSSPGLTNSVLFDGTVTNNGATRPVAGTTFFPSRNEWLFVGPQSLLGIGLASTVSGTAHGAGRWLASSAGWVTTLESGGRLTYPRCLRTYANSRLAFLGTVFLQFGKAVGTGEPLMTISDDGISWKAAINEPGSPNPFVNGGGIEAVCHGNGAWVAVGSSWFAGEQPGGAVFRSTNGYGWKRVLRVGNPWRHLQGVAFADGKFLAVAQSGTLLTSTNGLDWTTNQPIVVLNDRDAGTTNSVWMTRHLQGICHGPAGWIIPTSVGGTRLQSADGETWTELSGNSPGNGPYWQSFFADGKYWFSGSGEAYTTVDGTSWSNLQSIPSTHPVGVVSRAPDGVDPQYVGAGVIASSLVRSPNGANWTTAPLGGPLGWPRYLSVVSVSNEWVISGQPAVNTSGYVFPDDRPKRYPGDSDKLWVPNLNASVLSIRNGSSQWRSGFAGCYADFLLTTNGLLAARGAQNQLVANFLTGNDLVLSPSTALPSLSRSVPAQLYKGLPSQAWEWVSASLTKTMDGFDLFAETYTYATLQIQWGHFTSTNGSNWTRRANGLNHATNFPAIRGLAWGAGRFVAVSEGSSPGTTTNLTSPERIYTSTDGESYASAGVLPGLNGEGLTGVAYANGKFVAIGNSGSILSSINGLDWLTVRNSDGHRWNRVRYLDGVWAAVGNAGWLAFSIDGQTWSSRTAGAESDFADIAHQNGSYMVVGSHAMVLLSLPVTPAMILGETLSKLPGAGLQFNVIGHAGKLLDVQAGTNLVNWTSLVLKTNTTGTTVITDSQPGQARRFYRAVQLP